MNLQELRALKPQITAIAAPYGVHSIRVFGSVARGEATAESDVDLMVEGFEGSLLRFVHLQNELADAIGRRVDLCEPGNIKHPIVQRNVQKDLLPL